MLRGRNGVLAPTGVANGTRLSTKGALNFPMRAGRPHINFNNRTS